MKKFLKGSNSSRRNLPPDPLVPRMQLLDFPQQLLHMILLFLACNSFIDLHKAKVACNTFKNVIEEEVFFKEVDLFSMAEHEWYVVPLPQLTEFRLLCLGLGNPSAIFMRGLWDSFCNSKLEEGLVAIRVAADKCYDVAKYTYAMIQRTMTPHCVSDSPLINNLSRDFYTKTRRKINEAENSYAWGVEAPPLFQEKMDLISTAPLRCCECAPYTEVFYAQDFDERVKGGIGSPMCDRCFWIIQSVSLCHVMLRKVFNWPE